MTYPNSRLSHAKELYYIIFIVLLVVIGMFSVLGPGGYLEMKKARQELIDEKARVEALKRENEEKRKSIQALRTDKEAMERLARQNGYGRQGEIVQQLPEQPKPQSEAKKH